MPADNLHLTLVFLGPRDPAVVPEWAAALEQVAQAHAPFAAETGAAGGRASGRGGVAWLRIGRGSRDLSQISLAVDAALEQRAYDEGHKPRPHLTVARRVDDAAIRALSAWAQSRPPFAWQIDRLVLFRSHTGPQGSRYEELASLPLTRRDQPA